MIGMGCLTSLFLSTCTRVDDDNDTSLTVISGTTWVSHHQNVSILNLLELRTKEVVTTGTIRRAKLQSNCCYQQPTLCHFCCPINNVTAQKAGRKYRTSVQSKNTVLRSKALHALLLLLLRP